MVLLLDGGKRTKDQDVKAFGSIKSNLNEKLKENL
jgi:hypothetical protein